MEVRIKNRLVSEQIEFYFAHKTMVIKLDKKNKCSYN
nr:MAG TPA: hypothetical protein [Caudoviricetes sp.]